MFMFTRLKGSYTATQRIIKHIQSIFIELKPFFSRLVACYTKLFRLHALLITITICRSARAKKVCFNHLR